MPHPDPHHEIQAAEAFLHVESQNSAQVWEHLRSHHVATARLVLETTGEQIPGSMSWNLAATGAHLYPVTEQETVAGQLDAEAPGSWTFV